MKIIAVILSIFIFACLSQDDFDLNQICEGILFQAIPHPTDQSLFIGCVQGRGAVFGCEIQGEIFHPDLVECVNDMLITTTDETLITTTTEEPQEETTTTTETEGETTTTSGSDTTTSRIGDVLVSFDCPQSGFGFIPHRTNCSQYIECIRFVRNPRSCESTELHYDIISQECRPQNQALCADIIRCGQ